MEKTIAAVSTGMTASGISIVRMSGPEAIEVADRVFRSNRNKQLKNVKSHTIHYGYIYDGTRDIDEVLVSVMKAPHTFTGEDIVEINCHGGILVTKKVLSLLFDHGAVPAEPGEFTKRAFLNGRMDLSQAEAVADLIGAKNDFAARAAVNQLKGSVYHKIKEIRNSILDEVAFIEAALDDPEHYDLTGYEEKLFETLKPLEKEIRKLYEKAEYGSMISEGIKTVIAGRPNAGKSSLLNILAGYEKAIVTEIAGTTRDVLEENITLGSITLKLMDTAGIRNTSDKVEKIGVDRAMQALSEADLILYVIDSTEGITDEDRKVLSEIKSADHGDHNDRPVILLYNKSDLRKTDNETIKQTEREFSSVRILPFSALTGEGLEQLEDMIISMFNKNEISFNDEVIITGIRHKQLLKEAEKSIQLVFDGIREMASEEFLTVDLMNAYSSLGEIIGEEVDEDVVNRVFEKFCMGK